MMIDDERPGNLQSIASRERLFIIYTRQTDAGTLEMSGRWDLTDLQPFVVVSQDGGQVGGLQAEHPLGLFAAAAHVLGDLTHRATRRHMEPPRKARAPAGNRSSG